ncbi:reverse transcriptase family protein [Oricola cellulosilytica]|uniref:reverse transcriptase family protein n=1 Tax=Oricola cellulosilytica TaxID=1429082 RepID=UPI0013048EFC|nr:reverse transcriptase family protein [Oricola cellulosilytica]
MPKDKITALAYRNRPRYRIFHIHTGKKQRLIKAPIPSLRAAQKALAAIISEKLKPEECAHGYVTDRSVITHAASHLGKKAFFKTDIVDCFGSINFPEIANTLREAKYNSVDSFIAASIATDEGSLPQGAPSSPLLCNLVLRSVDRPLSKLADKLCATYTRYGDDIVMSADDFDINIISIVRNVLSRHGFKMNEDKTYIAIEPQQNIITGISIATGYPKVRKSFKRQVRLETHLLLKKGIVSYLESDGYIDPFAADRVLGKLTWWSHVEPDAEFPKKHSIMIRSMMKEVARG